MKLFSLVPVRWLQTIGTIVFMGAVLSMGSGCGALGAMANPKVAWAVNDPATMRVVIRRADAAARTAAEVDRLLTATPANPDSDWLGKVGPTKDDASTHMKTVGDMPMYKTSKARVVPSEVWIRTLPGITSADGKYPNLLAAVDPSLDDGYAKIMAKKKEIADLKAKIALEDAAADTKGISDADKKAHKDTIKDLEKQVSAAEDLVDPMQKDFVAACKAAASKATPDAKTKLGGAFVNLRQAVEDADIANGAAAVKYPFAAPGIAKELEEHVKFVVAGIIEEQTGKRPTLDKLKPEIKLDGTNVKVSLNGIGPEDLGKLSVGDVVTETVKRMSAWVGHALTLLGDISKTSEVLAFEGKVLDAVIDGFKTGGWTPPAPTKMDPGSATPGGAPAASGTVSMPKV